MSRNISPLAHVDARAELGVDVEIGPFCVVGPDVVLGDRTRLDSHVVVRGHTTMGTDNRVFPHCTIGGEPQDFAYRGEDTFVDIGNGNTFREGVTVNRGAPKEDFVTRIGNHCMLMSNAHVAHNCALGDHVMLVNGCLLGGHVHVHDRAIISGNATVHHFSTVGTLAFCSGSSKVVRDVPPYMLGSGSDDFLPRTINLVGMQRAGMQPNAIHAIKRAHRLLYREMCSVDTTRARLMEELDGIIPIELSTLFTFIENTNAGKMGRAREVVRKMAPCPRPVVKKAA